MNEKDDERLEHVWITWDDAYPWPTPEMGGDEYVRADLLATKVKEAREAAFRDAIEVVKQFDEVHCIVVALERADATDTDENRKRMRDG